MLIGTRCWSIVEALGRTLFGSRGHRLPLIEADHLRALYHSSLVRKWQLVVLDDAHIGLRHLLRSLGLPLFSLGFVVVPVPLQLRPRWVGRRVLLPLALTQLRVDL